MQKKPIISISLAGILGLVSLLSCKKSVPIPTFDKAKSSDNAEPAFEDTESEVSESEDVEESEGSGSGTAVTQAIESVAKGPVTSIPCVISSDKAVFENGSVSVSYNMSSGLATFSYAKVERIKDFYAAVQLERLVKSSDYKTRSCLKTGANYIVTSSGAGLPNLRQIFTLDGGNKFVATLVVEGAAVATNWMAPLIMETTNGLNIGSGTDPRFLQVPYDNDAWVSYDASPLTASATSFEVAAIYDNDNRNGLVLGSITHDSWKSAVSYSGKNKLSVYGGVAEKSWTRDVVVHGKISGPSVSSPSIFVGYSADWRDLMEDYAKANAEVVPRLNWDKGVPFGWNSWGKIQDKISYDKAIGVSNFIKQNLQSSNFSNDNTVYVNLDSYWDLLSRDQLKAFVKHVKGNGQKAGIYWAPFVDWGKNASGTVPGSNSKYEEIWLRTAEGNPIELDGAYAIDPTHPATKKRIDLMIDQFKEDGFEYIKLDFLTHGALESAKRYDPKVQTGTQAYNQGMKYIVNRIAGTMFISLSIAPLFPYQYGHARRVACDTYGAATGSGSSQYALNSATYGWWMSGPLYTFNDPDHMVFQDFSSNENMVRLLAAIITGTVFLNGDDLNDSNAQKLANFLLTNPRINTVARFGKAFRPVEGNTGSNPSWAMVLHDTGRHYLAVFNFGPPGDYVVDLNRAGFNGSTEYTVTDVFDNSSSKAKGSLKVNLDRNYAKIFEFK